MLVYSTMSGYCFALYLHTFHYLHCCKPLPNLILILLYFRFYSWRSVSDGSWFVHYLTECLKEYSKEKKMDLLSIFTVINQKMGSNPDTRKQVSCSTHTLTRRLLFTAKQSSSIDKN